MSILYTSGVYDLLHPGHINLFKACKKLADHVVVSLNTDEFVMEYKNCKPVMSYAERRELILGCKYVDEVIENIGGADSKPAILSVKPDILVVGSDWASKDIYKQMNISVEWLDKNGILLVYIPYTQGISTTELKKRIAGK